MRSRFDLPIAAGALVFSFAIPVGCGGAGQSSEETTPESTAAAEELEPYAPPEVEGTLRREALLPVLEAGIGRFLQGVETGPALDEGRFVGFRLVSFYPDDPRFEDVDLEPGDVVVRVNGQSIERPEEAFEVWSELRVASQLYIEYLRDGERREIRFDIVD